MTLAQIAAQIEDYRPLLNYGLGGVVIFWLMRFVDTRLASMEKAINSNTHKVSGLSRTLLIEMLSREGVSIQAKTAAREELAKYNYPTNAE